MKKLVIFDLDGTLLDSIADLAQAGNYALSQCGYPVHDVQSYKRFVGNGVNKLLERALPEGRRSEAEVRRLKTLFTPHYDAHCTDFSRPYPGMEQLLLRLHDLGVKLAVASNKYQAATEMVVDHYFASVPFVGVFGQRDGVPVKPDPSIISEILTIAGVAKTDALLVGDSEVDVQTGHNAGVEVCAVTWGFRPRAQLAAYLPAFWADSAEDILRVATRPS